jgi:hypothetical protein
MRIYKTNIYFKKILHIAEQFKKITAKSIMPKIRMTLSNPFGSTLYRNHAVMKLINTPALSLGSLGLKHQPGDPLS